MFWRRNKIEEPVVYDEPSAEDQYAAAVAERDAKRAELGIALRPFDRSATCPKCGLYASGQPYFIDGYRSEVYWAFVHASGSPPPGGRCSVNRGCPEGEHIHVHCSGCGYWYTAACVDVGQNA